MYFRVLSDLSKNAEIIPNDSISCCKDTIRNIIVYLLGRYLEHHKRYFSFQQIIIENYFWIKKGPNYVYAK